MKYTLEQNFIMLLLTLHNLFNKVGLEEKKDIFRTLCRFPEYINIPEPVQKGSEYVYSIGFTEKFDKVIQEMKDADEKAKTENPVTPDEAYEKE